MFRLVHQEHLDRFCPELAQLLAVEIAVGNVVIETTAGWPSSDSIVVGLKHPFKATVESLPEGVVHREVNDPHWWKSEYCHMPTQHLLICGFEN